jgi:hypothetical protein
MKIKVILCFTSYFRILLLPSTSLLCRPTVRSVLNSASTPRTCSNSGTGSEAATLSGKFYCFQKTHISNNIFLFRFKPLLHSATRATFPNTNIFLCFCPGPPSACPLPFTLATTTSRNFWPELTSWISISATPLSIKM